MKTELEKRIYNFINSKHGAFKSEIYKEFGCESSVPAAQGYLNDKKKIIDEAVLLLYNDGWLRLREDEIEHDWEWVVRRKL